MLIRCDMADTEDFSANCAYEGFYNGSNRNDAYLHDNKGNLQHHVTKGSWLDYFTEIPEDMHAYIFTYLCLELSKTPFTISFIDKDEDGAMRQWHDWVANQKFNVEQVGDHPELVK